VAGHTDDQPAQLPDALLPVPPPAQARRLPENLIQNKGRLL